MKITLTRYYGDQNITKSVMKVVGEDGVERMTCEAREPHYADYSEPFPGCSDYCLPVGKWQCKTKSTRYSPFTLYVVRSPGHRSTLFVKATNDRPMLNAVVVGESDGWDDPAERGLVNQASVFSKLEMLMRQAFIEGERIDIEVINLSEK